MAPGRRQYLRVGRTLRSERGRIACQRYSRATTGTLCAGAGLFSVLWYVCCIPRVSAWLQCRSGEYVAAVRSSDPVISHAIPFYLARSCEKYPLDQDSRRRDGKSSLIFSVQVLSSFFR